ncbi:MAG: PDZ domain-containing protein [Candidatus Sericytochromatia bacterium]
MKQTGYYRFPTISGSKIVFICEDDLWTVSSSGGVATRLTSNVGEITRPHLSPDGKWVAFTGREEGNPEVYCMPSDGGQERVLTFLGANTNVIGWTNDSKYILFTTNAHQPFVRINKIYKVHVEGGIPELLPTGLAHNISYSPKGNSCVIGIHTTDPARWKRYKGGTAGVIWIDEKGNGDFKKLIDIKGNLGSPMWIGDRIYFISDHEGIGNIYSCNPKGKDLKKHTNNKEYFVRNATTDGKFITYHCAGEIFVFDPKKDKYNKIEIEFKSPQTQRNRKFITTARYFEDYNIHPDGHSLAFNIRGKAFAMPNWDGTVSQLGEQEGVRYRLTQFLNRNHIVTISDSDNKEKLEVHSTDFDFKMKVFDKFDIGRALDMSVSPTEDKVVLSNHRAELILVDLEKNKMKVLDSSKYSRIEGFSWSPDGKWVTYALAETQNTISIKLVEIKTGKTYRITDTRFKDFNPSFDPEGKFIYFLSYREFNPVYDSMYFDLGFPRGIRPMLISLKKDTNSPFAPIPKFSKEEPKSDEKSKKQKKKDSKLEDKSNTISVEIDFEDIEKRVLAFPVPEGRYQQIWGLKGKVLYSISPIKGSLNKDWYTSEPEVGINLECFDFETQKSEVVATNISYFKVSSKNETLVYRSGNKLRSTSVLPLEKNKPADEIPSKKSGFIDLNRIKVSINPNQEWRQMYSEIWRLQQEHFWVADMCGIDWNKVYTRYSVLLDKITTRSEFSDLIWEMQGELGTSHAYEIGGDYRQGPVYRQGYFGADFSYDEKHDGFRVEHIVNGDSWNDRENSSLNRIGVNIKKGDLLVAINNKRTNLLNPPQKLLVNHANNELMLTFAGKKKNDYRHVMVKALASETSARYREWVENNRKKVHEATNGKVGYIHVPNMGPEGYSEFHRYYFAEVEKESVIIDVRYNGGGHVSPLLLEKLARKRIAYNVNRWGAPEPYPHESILGGVIAITNEYAGSDGDIFSHSYKLMGLGKLIGKRTWGGVIGIWPRHRLADGSVTTQPEFSFWFVDVGWGVENYGTEPDIEVEYRPQDWVKNHDPQLEEAIKLIMKNIKENPVTIPDFGDTPKLHLPEH